MGSVLVTGGCGFIGSEFVRQWMARESSNVVNLDKLTYAGNLHSLEEIAANPRYTFVHGDIADERCLKEIFQEHQPAAIINFAAESHVDRSIDGPEEFVRTNVLGTCRLLEEAKNIGHHYQKVISRNFVSFMFRRMKFMVRLVLRAFLLRALPTNQIHHTRLLKRLVTTL